MKRRQRVQRHGQPKPLPSRPSVPLVVDGRGVEVRLRCDGGVLAVAAEVEAVSEQPVLHQPPIDVKPSDLLRREGIASSLPAVEFGKCFDDGDLGVANRSSIRLARLGLLFSVGVPGERRRRWA